MMKFLNIVVLIFVLFLQENIYATPDSDYVPVAGYKNNPDAMKLRKFAGTERRVGLRLILNGIGKSEYSYARRAVVETLRDNSYFILNDLSDLKKIKTPSLKDQRGSKKNLHKNLLMTFVLNRSKTKDGNEILSFKMDWKNLGTKEQIHFESGNRIVDREIPNIQKLLRNWKSEILPIQDVFFISELRCVSNDKKTTRFLEIGCKALLQKDRHLASAKKYWKKAERIRLSEYDQESIRNNLGYYFISIGNFKKAEECFMEADSLDSSTDYRKHRYQLEEIQIFREKYPYYGDQGVLKNESHIFSYQIKVLQALKAKA
ncbi:hypothetical protein A0128_14110 [Leptospira tipperaryensis]|uniref:Tetratricopeptide repeat protein n=1 Tax=Leptospira tipperaryensis TaxID=2564040 RepID=A0A1D7UZ74_9LEPT|nr:hypothetical protein [Leptospira tipperaryensis]AOP34879.1 hypothetical protein A0128_14110 [Leptospira tipperaryensis]